MKSEKVIEKRDYIIIIDNSFEKQKFDCPVCKLCIRGLEDIESIDQYKACKDCQENFYWLNQKEWDEGWRPNKEEIYKKLNGHYLIKRK